MANWGNVQQGLVSGYEVGRSTGGGRMGQLGSLIKGVADRLRSGRETGEETKRKTGLLGIEGLIKGLIEPVQEGGFELPGVGRVKRTPPMELPEGFEISGYSAKGEPSIKKIKTTQTGQYREDLRRAKVGEISWEELVNIYPDKEKTIEGLRKMTLPPMERSPEFKFGRGLPALFSKNIANIDTTTMKVINNIKNQEDFDELLSRANEYKQAGVDVNAILEYFGKRK